MTAGQTISPAKLDEFMVAVRSSPYRCSMGYAGAARFLEELHKKGKLGDFLLDMAAAEKFSTGDKGADMERLNRLLTPERRAALDDSCPPVYPKLGSELENPSARFKDRGMKLLPGFDAALIHGMVFLTWMGITLSHGIILYRAKAEQKKDLQQIIQKGRVPTMEESAKLREGESKVEATKIGLGVTAGSLPIVLLVDFLLGFRKTDEQFQYHVDYFLKGLDDMIDQYKKSDLPAPSARGGAAR